MEPSIDSRLRVLEAVARGEDINPQHLDKQLIKEAISEWLDAKFTHFGKWSAAGLFVAAFAVVAYYSFTHGLWFRK